MELFARLGNLVYRRWQLKNFDERAFPEIAAAALRELPVDQNATYRDVIDAFVIDATLPVQRPHTGFGEPPIVVFESPGFYIEVLCWINDTTSIHQHTFSGAFQVMAGSSIHSTYRFEPRRRISGAMELGDLSFVESQLLRHGDVCPIVAGRAFIHSLSHLDRPSINVVVRTRRDAEHGIQWDYLRPGVALDPFADLGHDTRKRIRQLIEALWQMDLTELDRFVDRIIEVRDLETVFLVARRYHALAVGPSQRIGRERLGSVHRAVAARFGGDARLVLEALDEGVRGADLMRRCEEIHSAEHRFFLALLLNVPARAKLLELVAAYAPGPSRATVLRWLRELTCAKDPGHAALLELELELEEPLQGVRLADLLHATAAGMLEGLGGDALGARLVAEEPAFAALRDEVAALEAQLRTGALRPLFSP